jgi:hypothetical protein
MNDVQGFRGRFASACYWVARKDPKIRAAQWAMTAPLRLHVRSFPIKRDKGIAHAIVIRTAMREP